MDTQSAMIFGQGLPEKTAYTIEDKNSGKDLYKSILDESEPFNPEDGLFNNEMIYNIITASIYQQSVLTVIFYYGEVWFEVFFDKDFVDSVHPKE